jgi:hypothetical protein
VTAIISRVLGKGCSVARWLVIKGVPGSYNHPRAVLVLRDPLSVAIRQLGGKQILLPPLGVGKIEARRSRTGGLSVLINFTVGGKEHSYLVPVFEFSLKIPQVGPGPINIPRVIFDASKLALVEDAAKRLSDPAVRDASAVQALEKRGGVRISLETAGAPPTRGGAHGPGRD